MKHMLNALFVRGVRSTQPEIIIVSGLPRSGTSMMMQMLGAGGLPLLVDDHRQPDDSNPRGYYEYEAVKRLRSGDDQWLAKAEGHAVKVVSPLLHDLPGDYAYRVIFMRRTMTEILQSQTVMLRRLGRQSAARQTDRLRQEYDAHLTALQRWLAGQSYVHVLDVDYHSVLQQPEAQAVRVADFVGQRLNIAAMTRAVDPSLHRERAAHDSTPSGAD